MTPCSNRRKESEVPSKPSLCTENVGGTIDSVDNESTAGHCFGTKSTGDMPKGKTMATYANWASNDKGKSKK
eukprot:14992356-Ditylum_brightwellii.AAC.1